MTQPLSRRRLHVAALPVAVIALLTGCAPLTLTPVPPAPTTTPDPQSSAGPGEAGGDFVFSAPGSCTELVGAELEAEFAANDSVLFADSLGNGLYAPLDPIGQDGGDPFYCLYGAVDQDYSTFELAAQPLTPEEHEGVIAELGTRGYEMQEEDGFTAYLQEGFEGSRDDPELDAAIVHIVYPDGWITAYSTFGGPTRLDEVIGWATVVDAQVYPAP